MPPVVIARCSDYDQVEGTLHDCLAPLGGMERFVSPGQRVLLKPNLLSAAEPEAAITTHPAVVRAVARLVKQAGGRPIVADSPGVNVSSTEGGLRRLYRITGLLALAEAGEIELSYDATPVSVANPDGKVVKRLDLFRPAVEADVVIALPKLKTHALTKLTGGMKILFGAVPGFGKPGYHAAYHDPRHFGDLLLDIIAAVRPALFVMDAVLAMEGNGPGRDGTPRHVGLLLASSDAVALDLAVCQLIGLDPAEVPTLRAARDRGLWNGRVEPTLVGGGSIRDFAIQDFRLPRAGRNGVADASSMIPLPDVFRRMVVDLFSATPRPAADRCTGCGSCVKACPVDAIRLDKRLAVVDRGACIRCYCCHELCPEAAIDLRVSRVGRAVSRLSGR
jgi:uncharacterized protein (DUF362 family)/ferredoxin